MTSLTSMDSTHYYECWLQAEEWAAEPTPQRKPISMVLNGKAWPEVSTAVYIAVDLNNDVHYVGSVCREALSGLRGRLRGHEQTSRFSRWRGLYVVPLLGGTPEPRVRAIESEIGFILKPPGNIRLPARGGVRPI